MQMVAILNPAAGNGAAGRQRERVEAALRGAGLSYRLWCSEAPGHAVALARQAAAEVDAVVAIGGDGTVQEVARGVLAAGGTAHLGVMPLGTGNDFIKMLRMPIRLQAAAQALAAAQPRAVDYGTVQWDDPDGIHEQIFINAVGIGFDACVAMAAGRFKHWPGMLGYLGAVVKTMRHWEGPSVRIEGTLATGRNAALYEGALLLATAGNGVSSGGAFYLTPHASITDGLLDVCIVEHITPGRIMRVVPLALRGRHESEREVHTFQVRHLGLTAQTGLPVHADGEILARAACAVTIHVHPGGLSVLQPV